MKGSHNRHVLKQGLARPWGRAGIGFAILLLTLPLLTYAQSGHNLSWWTVDGGGGTGSGDSYSMSGTVGQSEVGVRMAGGDYTLTGGFWRSDGPGWASQVYLPLLMR